MGLSGGSSTHVKGGSFEKNLVRLAERRGKFKQPHLIIVLMLYQDKLDDHRLGGVNPSCRNLFS